MSDELHRVLRRQLRKAGASLDESPGDEAWTRFVQRVEAHYRATDDARYTLLRSIDISSSEMEQLHQAVEDERAQLAALFDAMPQGVFVVDDGGRVQRCNAAAARLVGQVSMGVELTGVVELVDRRGAPLAFTEAATHDQVYLSSPDGGLRPVDVDHVAIHGGGVLVTLTDLTERVAQRERLKEAVLDAEVARRAEQARGMFLANMSHELRTPLNAILGYTDLLRDDPRDEQTLADLDRIHAAGTHLLGLINDVLDLSKVDAGKTELRPEQVSIDDLVFRIVDDLRPAAADNGTRIFVSGQLVGNVRIDPTRVRQCLYNLLSNACRYTVDGRIDVWVRTRQHTGGLSRLLISVADTGAGIAPDDLDTIFEPFAQGRAHIGGTGLGLALVRSLTELMGGRAYAKSTLGEGSVFTLDLPLERGEGLADGLAELGLRQG